METVTVGERISIEPNFHVKPSGSGYHIVYARFRVYQKGFYMDETLVSTGVQMTKVDKAERWNGTRFKVKKNDEELKKANTKLNEVETIVKDWFADTKKKKTSVASWREILHHIKEDLKPLINPEGKKATKEQKRVGTMSHLIEVFLEGKDVSKGYRRKFVELNALLIEYNMGLSLGSEASNNRRNEFKNCDEYLLAHADDELTASHLNKQFTKNFVGWLHNRMNKHNAAVTYAGKLRSLVKLAVEREFISFKEKADKGTFKGFRRGDGVNLLEHELMQISAIGNLLPGMVRMKNLFLFMCATGLGLGELRAVQKHHFREIDGTLFLMKDRVKSEEPFKIPISPIAARIYNEYFNPREHATDTVAEFEPFEELPSDTYCLDKFKELAKMAGINKVVGTYTPRRTFATNYIRMGGSIYELQKIMGHANIKTTLLYVNLANDDLSKDAFKVYANSVFHNQP